MRIIAICWCECQVSASVAENIPSRGIAGEARVLEGWGRNNGKHKYKVKIDPKTIIMFPAMGDTALPR